MSLKPAFCRSARAAAPGLKVALSRHSRGLTLLEILVAVLILALVMVGLTNVFIVARQYLKHIRSRLTAAELSQIVINPLQNDVRQDTWNANDLAEGERAGPTFTVDDAKYNSEIAIYDQAASSTLRKANVTMSWDEDY